MTNTEFTFGTRVRVVNDPYGTWRGMEGTVVPVPPEIVRMHRYLDTDIDPSIWVHPDDDGEFADTNPRDGYAPRVDPGFLADELERI